ncbi:MAG TPA: hypothetical protein PK708_09705 [Candidatus Competibacter sp.]|jgi:hypothetical protein|nr:hypothetical protein [Candidatus Competibacter sp.]HRF63147.1 hypothetical protein [Candidatus Competibacter sp.]
MSMVCEALFKKYVNQYQAGVAEGRLSKWVIGVTATGQRIEIDLNSLKLGPFEKDKLIKCALEAEGAECYVYATNVRIMDEETHKLSERVLIVCATAADYVGGDWGVMRAADGTMTLKPLGEWSGQDPEQTPGTWFLTDTILLEPDEQVRYAAIWAELRDQCAACDASS